MFNCTTEFILSHRSAGKEVEFDGEMYKIEELKEDSFDDIDIALFSAGGSISKKFGPIAAKKGCFVVDNSSAFRLTEGVPLIIPEVNGDCQTNKWKLEMLLLSLMQIASDLILLVPFFVTGKKRFQFQLLLTLISSFFDKLS